MASIFHFYIPIFMAYSAFIFALSFASYPHYFPPIISSISAAPEFSPAPEPDISPLFPTPSGAVLPPSSLPTIPSSPSPPNPDFIVAPPAPELPLPPSQSLPFSAASALSSCGWCCLVLVALTAAFGAELCR